MSHGVPDFGQTAGITTTYQLLDLAELAARLGSIVTFDRRGDVLFLESFEDGDHRWLSGTSGTGAEATLSTERARTGVFSFRLTGGSDSSRYAMMRHIEALVNLAPLGFELSASFSGDIDRLEMLFYVYTGADLLLAGCRWDGVAKQLDYRNDSGTWVTFATGVTPPTTPLLFNTLKIVIDPTLEEYVRFLLNANTYSLTGKALQKTASAVIPQMLPYVYLYSPEGQNSYAYVDDVILTQNEP